MKTTYDPSGIETSFINILDDIYLKGRLQRSVLILPAVFGGPDEETQCPVWVQWYQNLRYIKTLNALGVSTVVSAGNDRSYSEDSTHFPAMLQVYEYGKLRTPVLVSGAVDLSGVRASFSQALGTEFGSTYWAPGKSVACAGMHNESDIVYKSGTSFSAPMVSCMCALVARGI